MPAPFWWIHQILSDYHASDIVIKSNSHPDMLSNEWYRDNIITSSKKNELLDANYLKIPYLNKKSRIRAKSYNFERWLRGVQCFILAYFSLGTCVPKKRKPRKQAPKMLWSFLKAKMLFKREKFPQTWKVLETWKSC